MFRLLGCSVVGSVLWFGCGGLFGFLCVVGEMCVSRDFVIARLLSTVEEFCNYFY
mgnify:CR=1 FL=1